MTGQEFCWLVLTVLVGTTVVQVVVEAGRDLRDKFRATKRRRIFTKAGAR
jgi:hypothetical protein